MKKSLQRSLVCTAMVLLLCLLFSMSAMAAGPGQLNLHCKVGDRPLAGDTYSLVLIAKADVNTDAKNMKYTIVDVFKAYDRDWTYTSSGELQELSVQLRDYVLKENISRSSARTDRNGDISWAGLEPGLYLVFREKVRNTGYGDTPILLSVPQIMNKEIVYDVSVTPKFTDDTQGNGGDIDTDWEGSGGKPNGGDGGTPTGDISLIPVILMTATGGIGFAVTDIRRRKH